MKCSQKTDASGLLIEVEGDIDEDAMFPDIAPEAKDLFVDVGKVTHLNSCGIREWIRWIKPNAMTHRFHFKDCPKVIIDQVNTVEGFMPKGSKVISFRVPYFCNACENVSSPTFVLSEVVKGDDLLLPGSVECKTCKKDAEMDVVPERYFKFIQECS